MSRTLRDPVEIGDMMGGDTAVLPARPGDYRLETQVVRTPQLTCHWMSHHGDVVIEESNPASQVFGLLGDRYVDASVGGMDVRPGAVTATDPEPHVVRLRGRNDYVLMEVPDRWVEAPAGALCDLAPTPGGYARLAHSLAHLRRLALGGAAGDRALCAASESVADALFEVVAEASPRPALEVDLANAIVCDAIAAIREDRVTSIAELTREVAASRSSLYRSFESIMGMSPYAYMQQRRLTKLRQRLLTVDDSPGVVTREAAVLGAFHLGNLAHSYRKLFGERPSDTVKRSRAEAAAVGSTN